jgi:hypothetical protein
MTNQGYLIFALKSFVFFTSWVVLIVIVLNHKVGNVSLISLNFWGVLKIKVE